VRRKKTASQRHGKLETIQTMANATPNFSIDHCSVTTFADLIEKGRVRYRPGHQAAMKSGIPVYDSERIRNRGESAQIEADIMSEWAHCLAEGPGVFVLERAFPDVSVVDRVSYVFDALIEKERAAGQSAGDHFAAPGTNARVWNALEKLCIADTEAFAHYYSNDMIARAAESWLGPNYQITSQVNVVYPGARAQEAHRDYHLGFMNPTECAAYPPHVHHMSARLTLQGAVAHCDMPLASGPTKLLPFSQLYTAGYLACHREDFRQYFDVHCVQLELRKGDALFFNPALFHAAGSNQSAHIARMANLLQISSAFGRAMERVNRRRMSVLLYRALSQLRVAQSLSRQQEDAAIVACAEGYAFPTDLDLHPPLNGRAPENGQSLLRRALDESWREEQFKTAIESVSGDT